MKHNLKITLVLIFMFLITQLIGLLVVYADPFTLQQEVNGTLVEVSNPFFSFIEPPTIQEPSGFFAVLPSIIFAFILAIVLIFLLSKLNLRFFLKGWFFLVVVLVLTITLFSFLKLMPFEIQLKTAFFSSLGLALVLGFFKIFRGNMWVHNLTELMIYPGIAVVFIPLLNIWTMILLLIIISIYDMWAVWHSGFMQKMAKFQMDELKIFSGFFVPYLTKKQRAVIKKAKKTKTAKTTKSMKINIAILGGGDVVFPIITAGIVFNALGLIPALIVILSATIALLSLFIFAKKGKFYPAMPFLSAGLLVGIGLAYLFF